jgi:hypothetical protein
MHSRVGDFWLIYIVYTITPEILGLQNIEKGKIFFWPSGCCWWVMVKNDSFYDN